MQPREPQARAAYQGKIADEDLDFLIDIMERVRGLITLIPQRENASNFPVTPTSKQGRTFTFEELLMRPLATRIALLGIVLCAVPCFADPKPTGGLADTLLALDQQWWEASGKYDIETL